MSICNKCNEEESSSLCCQYDFRQSIYKFDSNELSKLSFLGINRGDNLEYVVEKLGQHILDSNPNFVASFGYEQKTLPELFDTIFARLNVVECKAQANYELLSGINDKLIALTEKVKTIEYPNIIDTRALGFTKYDTIQKVIQIINDKV